MLYLSASYNKLDLHRQRRMNMNNLPVLIVGAGPTGLMMACELARRHIPFRIIDKKPEQTQGSNATWIQPRTLEILDAMGIVDQFIKIGHECHAINFYDKGKHLVKMSLDGIDSAYPFILMLPQRETERLLNKQLEESKIYIERSLELINIHQNGDHVTSVIRLPDGTSETITSDWVIGCDGANSIIRNQCQIAFPGEDIPEQFMVADAEMTSFLPTDEIHVFFDKGNIFPDRATIFSAFPWGDQQYRLNANLYMETPRQVFHQHEVKEVVSERTYGNFVAKNVSWISAFWIHSKIVPYMRHHSIFLAGDAAHTHSPAGGQGMNAGLQDAYNLAWKLALVIENKAKKSILDSYQLERHSIVKKIVEQTEKFTQMMLFDKTFFTKLHKFSQSIADVKIAKKMMRKLTQMDNHYQDSPIIDYPEKMPAKSPQPGECAPDVIIDKSKNLYQYFCHPCHNVLLFSGLTPEKDKLEAMVILQNKIKQTFPDLIKSYIISKNSLNIENFILDAKDTIHNNYHIKNSAIYVIRPDNYIAYYSENFDIKSLERFLNKYLI